MTNDFSAKAPSLGYYYQIRYGLFLLLSDDGSEDKSISLETLDDIVVQDLDQTNLFQTKYHLKKKATLTDRSEEIWKTIRVWCENIKSGKVNVKKTIFTLVSSANCAKGSILEKLKGQKITIDEIISELDKIAQETTNKTNEKGYIVFTNLEYPQKEELVRNIQVVDGALDFEEIENKIRTKLRLSVEPSKISSLFERLEGWWFNECIHQLKAATHIDISFQTLAYKITEIREQLMRDNLPLDFINPLNISDEDLVTYENKAFVKQLKLINIGVRTLKNSISDFHRAFEQRSKWVREELLNPHEEDRYEKRLLDDWKARFELMEDDSEGKNADELSLLGKSFYENFYLKQFPQIFIRDKFKERFMVTGSCHILAEREKIGWHPSFNQE